MKFKNLVVFCYFFVAATVYAGFSETGDFAKYQKRLSLRALENQTQNSSFKVFYANQESMTTLTPGSIYVLKAGELFLQQHEILCLQCVKGSFLPIYIKDEGKVGGQAPAGFHGPYYFSMWLNYPDVSEDQKQYVRYVVKIGKSGEFAVRINPQGDCQVIALANMQLLP